VPHLLNEILLRGNDPFVGDVLEFTGERNILIEHELRCAFGLKSADILEQESVGIVPGQKHVPHYAHHALFVEVEVFGSHQWRINEIQSHGISSIGIDDFHWIGVVALALAHLFALVIQNQSIHNKILVGCIIPKSSRYDIESVEPSSCLIDSLCNEISWEYLAELLFLHGEGVVLLSVGHRTRLKPAIKYLIDTPKYSLACLRGNRDLINEFTVEIGDASDATQSLQLFNGANAHDLRVVFADPDGDGVAPEAVPGEAPVLCILEPIIEATLLRKRRHPMTLLIVLHQVLLDVSHPNEPTMHSLVDEGGFGSPAEWIIMPHLRINEQSTILS
jgi:hypothetical protein